jgi:IS5 family transposase
VDLSEEGEVVDRNKGYFGVKLRGYDAMMRRGVKGSSAGRMGQAEEQAYQQEEGAGERLFAVIKRGFKAGYVVVTTVPCVHVKMVFAYFCFNLVQLGTLAGRS